MEDINEKILDAWLRISTIINNERLVSDMTYNESLICNILYRKQKENPDINITATDLCNKTRMLKSQMNRTLNNLEKRGIIVRERSNIDRRQVFIMLDEKMVDTYMSQHTKILELVDSFVEKFGKEKTIEIVNVLNLISDMAEEVM